MIELFGDLGPLGIGLGGGQVFLGVLDALIERGLISPGAKLTDAKKRHKALVRADGAVSFGDNVGSIHKMGAMAQGLDACNGWTFWHIETPKGLTLIDDLRAKIRAEMAD